MPRSTLRAPLARREIAATLRATLVLDLDQQPIMRGANRGQILICRLHHAVLLTRPTERPQLALEGFRQAIIVAGTKWYPDRPFIFASSQFAKSHLNLHLLLSARNRTRAREIENFLPLFDRFDHFVAIGTAVNHDTASIFLFLSQV